MAKWFAGQGRNHADEAVLAAVRRQVSESGLADVRPEDTAAATLEDQPLVLTVRVPGLDAVRGRPEFQVGVDPEEPTDACLLGAWETWGYVLDVGVCGFIRPDPDRSPAGLAAGAVSWLQEQLRRPVQCAEWDLRRGKTKRVWRFADDGELLASDFGTGRLRRRRAPDRVAILR
jgi:hypothetical protein